MSLDLGLICKVCGNGESDFNITYNLSGMWYEVFPGDDGMIKIEGMTGKESAPRLKKVLEEARKDPERFKKHEPENGWGSYDGFVNFLGELIEAAEKNPSSVWKAWR